MSALFADVRGSRPLAERLGPSRTHSVIDRFYTEGVDPLVHGGAMGHRFMGDQTGRSSARSGVPAECLN